MIKTTATRHKSTMKMKFADRSTFEFEANLWNCSLAYKVADVFNREGIDVLADTIGRKWTEEAQYLRSNEQVTMNGIIRHMTSALEGAASLEEVFTRLKNL